MITRRKVLKIIGGGVILSATGLNGCAVLEGPSRSARVAWRNAGQESEFRRSALSYALLAPNPHNRQPWLVELVGEDALTLYCDLGRRLPATDPHDRQTTIGCGAFLELLKIAAAQDGYSTQLILFPEGENMQMLDSRPIAHVVFSKTSILPDPLFHHILTRRSNKNEYSSKKVLDKTMSRLVKQGESFGVAIDSTSETKRVSQLQALCWQAYATEANTREAYQESIDLMRFGPAEVAKNPDGITMDSRFLSMLNLTGMINRNTIADPISSAFQQSLEMYLEKINSTSTFLWLRNNGDTRLDEINAGRAYLRVNLQATKESLALHPISQALQEYPQMSQIHQSIHQLIGKGKRIQMFARVGYAPSVIATPRWGLNKHIKRPE